MDYEEAVAAAKKKATKVGNILQAKLET